jgi:hypothetical protein
MCYTFAECSDKGCLLNDAKSRIVNGYEALRFAQSDTNKTMFAYDTFGSLGIASAIVCEQDAALAIDSHHNLKATLRQP